MKFNLSGVHLQLARNAYAVGEALDSGGFGQVYELASAEGPLVAKFVPKQPGASRELLFVELGGVRNVVPIIDSGEHEDFWVLVMPRADTSLRKHLEASAFVLDLHEVVDILKDICDALVDLDGGGVPLAV